MLRVSSNYKFIPKEHTVKKEMYDKIPHCLKDAVQRKGPLKSSGNSFFCTTTNLHISSWW
jgi:hypothetical protein